MMRKNYKVTFKQRFMGEVIEDSYVKYQQTVEEMDRAIDALCSDPHVFRCWYEELEEEV